jgi:hypothetical protein
MMKRPSAFLPVTMSSVALAVVLAHVTFFGVAREADEGVAAHIFQLLIGLQIPIVACFAIKWLPRSPREGIAVLILQLAVALAALTPVYALNL